jgi:hypothetical protein
MGKIRLAAYAAFACFACASAAVLADDHPYSEGPILSITSIRTVDGKFEEYKNWLATKWNHSQEAAKKAGYITAYEVVLAEPHGPNEPDLYLVITMKNCAALDGAFAKNVDITLLIEGSLEKANQALSERGKIRTVLGSQTVQMLQLK